MVTTGKRPFDKGYRDSFEGKEAQGAQYNEMDYKDYMNGYNTGKLDPHGVKVTQCPTKNVA